MGGDGSLYIPNIQPSDDGEYTCTVIVTPEKAIRKVTMEVSAVPTCTVSDSRLEMHPDTERSVTCYVSGFYPQSVRIHWEKYSKVSFNKAKLDDWTYTSIPVQNHDGTYNVRSLLSVRPMSRDEDGDVYSCVISHRSLRDPLTCNVTISLQPVQEVTCLMIGIGLGIALLLLLSLVLSVIYGHYIRKAPPQVLDVAAPELIHGIRTTLTCPILNYRPRNMEINLYLMKDDEETLVDAWSIRQTDSDENRSLLYRPLVLDPVILPPVHGVSSCICYIHITPDKQEHHGAKLILEVHHKALEAPIRKGLTLWVTGTLEIRRMDSPIEKLQGHDIILPCLFYGYEASPLDLSTVSVRWTLRTSEGERQVYWFNGGIHFQNRPESHISESGLTGGDGSLYIYNLHPSDDGEYTCAVIVTPENAISKVTMEVSVVPTCTVSDPSLEMTPDTERSVTCHVSAFYPEPVTIRWIKYSKVSSKNFKLDDRTYISIPIQNYDGTYNMKSLLSVRPMSTEEDGDVYSCVITHRTLKDDALTCNLTISVHPLADNTVLITGAVLGILLLLLYYFSHIRKAPPKVLDIAAPELIHGKQTTLTCHIVNFRPSDIEINLYLIRDNEETLADTWPPRRNENDEEYPLLHHPLTLLPVISPSINGAFLCTCYIYIIPDIHVHDGAKLMLEVHHKALTSPIVKKLRMKVTGKNESYY
ncbi:uncharacterized protein [Dendropsophus ebraccatus]|uniref:uncharacterized protein n=1 Tax=Dendropsophus ebraccatus TaxID=150705 RepID=UPI00383140BB